MCPLSSLGFNLFQCSAVLRKIFYTSPSKGKSLCITAEFSLVAASFPVYTILQIKHHLLLDDPGEHARKLVFCIQCGEPEWGTHALPLLLYRDTRLCGLPRMPRVLQTKQVKWDCLRKKVCIWWAVISVLADKEGRGETQNIDLVL